MVWKFEIWENVQSLVGSETLFAGTRADARSRPSPTLWASWKSLNNTDMLSYHCWPAKWLHIKDRNTSDSRALRVTKSWLSSHHVSKLPSEMVVCWNFRCAETTGGSELHNLKSIFLLLLRSTTTVKVSYARHWSSGRLLMYERWVSVLLPTCARLEMIANEHLTQRREKTIQHTTDLWTRNLEQSCQYEQFNHRQKRAQQAWQHLSIEMTQSDTLQANTDNFCSRNRSPQWVPSHWSTFADWDSTNTKTLPNENICTKHSCRKVTILVFLDEVEKSQEINWWNRRIELDQRKETTQGQELWYLDSIWFTIWYTQHVQGIQRDVKNRSCWGFVSRYGSSTQSTL